MDRKFGLGAVGTVVLAGAVLVSSCGDEGGGGGGGAKYTINTSGGDGDTLAGGGAGNINIQCYGTYGISVVPTATVDWGFDVPADPTPDVGYDPVVCSANMTIPVYQNMAGALADAGLADESPYLVVSDGNLYIRDRTIVAEYRIATGLEVKSGSTVTLSLNQNTGGLAGEDATSLNFLYGVHVAGTLRTATLDTAFGAQDLRLGSTSPLDRGGLVIWSLNRGVTVASGGRIDTSGLGSADASRAGCGGCVNMQVRYVRLCGLVDASGGSNTSTGDGGAAGIVSGSYSSGVYISTTVADIVVGGAGVDCSGGDGAVAGDGAPVVLTAFAATYCTGDLVAAGGSGDAAGEGGAISIGSQDGIFLSGTLDTRSGAGGGSASSDTVMLTVTGAGDLVVSGPILTHDRSGGGAGDVNIGGAGGDVKISGGVSMHGCADPDGPVASAGRTLTVNVGAGGGGEPSGSIYIKGDIDLRGAADDTGSGGGYLAVSALDTTVSPDYGVTLVGYSEIVAEGGDGSAGGASAGMISFTAGNGSSGVSGPVDIRTDVSLVGGNGKTPASSTGANGGSFSILSDPGTSDPASTVAFSGVVDASGGTGATQGGVGGLVQLAAYDDVSWEGTVTAGGGACTGTGDCQGGSGGQFLLTSSLGDVTTSGTCSLSGADSSGTDNGAFGGIVTATATLGTVTARMAFDLHGGEADAGNGGNGGQATLNSPASTTVYAASTFNLAGGASVSGTDGGPGTLTVDGVVIP